MSFARFATSLVALAAFASAQDGCSFAKAVTITSPGDASSIGACSTIVGDVVFATGAAAPTLALASVQEIQGALTYANDDTVSSIQAPLLKKISKKIQFNNLTKLNNVGLNSLQQSGDVSILGCASLSMVTTGPQYSSAGLIELSNTYLSTMGGFGNLTKVTALSISGNPLLADITMNIASVKSIEIGSNEEANKGLNVQFDNLTMATDHIFVQNATNVSFASLQTVTNNLELISNNFQSFAAPNLSYAGGLVLNSNPQLTTISLPSLVALNGSQGTFQIANNSQLSNITGFPKLTTLAHDVTFTGSFKSADISGFKVIAAALVLQSTQDITDTCNIADQLKKSQVVRGNKVCKGSDPNASGTTAKGGSGTGSGSGSSSSSSGAAVPLNIPALPALSAGLGAAVLQFFLSF